MVSFSLDVLESNQPDLPDRLQQDLPLNAYNRATFYTPGAIGYTDYARAQKINIAQRVEA
jgi:hypothetical protein